MTNYSLLSTRYVPDVMPAALFAPCHFLLATEMSYSCSVWRQESGDSVTAFCELSDIEQCT